MDEGCTQPLSSDPTINLNTTVFSFLCLSPVCEESPQLGASRPYNDDHKRCTKVRDERATHTRLNSQHNHAHKSQLELKTQRMEFTTQMELKSLSQRIECTKLESRSIRMYLECLGVSSMRLGVPFIAPRQLGAIGGQQGRPKLPSVGWCTGQSGAPPDSHCRRSGADLLPFLAQMTIAAPSQLAHQTLSGAHRTVRCPLPTVGTGHVSPADCATDRCASDRRLTGQSGAPPNSPVNYSRTPPIFPKSGLFTGSQHGASDTVRCARLSWTSVVHSQVTCNPFLLFFSLFLALRQNMLVLKTMY
jgi:hypothetical protein